MFKSKIKHLQLTLMLSIGLLLSCNDLTFVSIGTGAVTGIYYPTGGAICRMINKKMSLYHIKATVESTAGSVFNVNAVLSGDLEFGLVQSDRQYQAIHGLSEWKQMGLQKKLRSVFSIHTESVCCSIFSAFPTTNRASSRHGRSSTAATRPSPPWARRGASR